MVTVVRTVAWPARGTETKTLSSVDTSGGTLLVVIVAAEAGNDAPGSATVLSATFNGASMTPCGNGVSRNYRALRAFYTTSPAGTADVVVSTSETGARLTACAYVLAGTDLVSPLGTVAEKTFSASSVTTDGVTLSAGGLVLSGVATRGITVLDSDGSNELLFDDTVLDNGAATAPGGTGVTIAWTWTGGSVDGAVGAYAILPAAATFVPQIIILG